MGLRVALVGAGWVGRTVWVPLLQQHSADVCVVVDPSGAAREAAQLLLPGAIAAESLDQGLVAGCDLAFICSPNAMHTEHALQVMQMGLDAVVEKPVCFSVEEAQTLIDFARLSGRRLRSTSASSFRSDVGQLRNLVAGGSLGKVVCIDASWRRRSGVPRPGSWFTQRSSAIGGSAADLGWHVLEVALGLLSYPEVDEGLWQHAALPPDNADAAALWLGEQLPANAHHSVDIDAQTFGCLKTSNGAMVRLATAWCSHQELDETVFSIYCERGELNLRCTFGFTDNRVPQPHLELRQNGRTMVLSVPVEAKVAPYQAYVQALLAGLDRSVPVDAKVESAEHRKLRSLSSAMACLYPSKQSSRPI